VSEGNRGRALQVGSRCSICGLDGKTAEEGREISRIVIDVLLSGKFSGHSGLQQTSLDRGLVLQTHLFHQDLCRLRIGAAGDGDEYGGSLENRMRFPLEVFEAVRAAFAPERPVTMRVSGTDWAEGEWSIEETIAFVEALQARGAAAINVSSGGSSPSAQIPVGPGYQLPLARAVKQATALPVIAVGLITDFEQAESILRSGDADLIALARAMLYDPRWSWHAAAHFGTQIRAPKQYLRSQPSGLRNLFV
jgi:hypothetical protein